MRSKTNPLRASNTIIRFGWIVLALAVIRAEAVQWDVIGPYGGDQYDIRVSPSNSQTLFALSMHGVNRSRDAGASWQPKHVADMSPGGYTGFTFDPLNTQTIYVGTGFTGVWESRNEGDSWSRCGWGLPTLPGDAETFYPVDSLVKDGTGNLYASIGSPAGELDPPARIYRSQGGCGEWLPDDIGISTGNVNLTQESVILLSLDAQDRVWAVVYGDGVYLRAANGWESRNGDLPEAALKATFLVHDAQDPDRLLLATEDQWVFESLDEGVSWVSLSLPDALLGLPTLPLVYSLTLDPNNTQTVVAMALDASVPAETPLFHSRSDQVGGLGVYVNHDGAGAWERLPVIALHLAMDPSETVAVTIPQAPQGTVTSRFWYLTSLGKESLMKIDYSTSDPLAILEGMAGLVVNRVWVHPDPAASYTELLMAASEAGLYRRMDQGPDWEFNAAYPGNAETNYILYSWSFAADWFDRGSLYYSTGNPAWDSQDKRGVYRKDLSCFGLNCPAPTQLLSDVGVWQVLSTPALPQTLYAATQENGVMVSEDRGVNWSYLNWGLPANASVTTLALDSDGSPRLAGLRTSNGEVADIPMQPWWMEFGEPGGIYHYDAGVWVQSEGVSMAVSKIMGHPQDINLFYAATAQGVYRSEDGGLTWQAVFPDIVANDLVVDPIHPDYVYVATDAGVLRSTTRGDQWHDLSDSLRQLAVLSLDINPETGVLYGATNGNSIFQLLPAVNPQPVIFIDPQATDFGVVPLHFAAEKLLAVENLGEGDLQISEIVFNDSQFSLVGPALPLTIPPMSTDTVRLRFEPTRTGVISAAMSVGSNDPMNPDFPHGLVAEGRQDAVPAPDVRINGSDLPAAIAYGDVFSVKARLQANDYLTLKADYWVRLDTPNGDSLWLVDGQGLVASETPLLLYTVPMSDSDFTNPLWTFNFTAGLSGEYTVQFWVDDNADGVFDGTWSDSVSVTAGKSSPKIQLTDTALDYGNVAVGFGKIKAFGIGNAGEQELVISDLSFGSSAYQVQESSLLPITLQSGQSAQITVEFAPPAEGEYPDTLVITSNAPLTPAAEVALNGAGRAAVVPVPDARINGSDAPPAIAYGESFGVTVELLANDNVGVNADYWVKLTAPNGDTLWADSQLGMVPSATPLRLFAIPMTDTVTPLLDFALTAGLSGNYTVEFWVDDNADGVFDGTWGDSVTITVRQKLPAIVITTGSLEFGGVAVGFDKVMAFGIGNAGEQDLVIDDLMLGSADFVIVEPGTLPVTLAQGESVMVKVRFAPAALGESLDTLVVSSNDPNQPNVILSLLGLGEAVQVPVPDVKINGLDDPVFIQSGDSAPVSIAVNGGSHAGQQAELWFYLVVVNFNQLGEPQLEFVPLVNLPMTLASFGPIDLLNGGVLPNGLYILLFAVDMQPNGQFDPGDSYFDTSVLGVGFPM
ncbi:MAG: choice-of-anchor D domain-containing protein [Gammaproteobacteria bacterium]|nr:choice-of-anchor D domain-containing protein [Gammaproteobacteria bacterium]